MKKILSFALAGAAALALSGCAGDVDNPTYNNYYITDATLAGVPGIVWNCDMGTDGTTNNTGKFYTETGDSCDLDLRTNLIVNNIYLEDDAGNLNGILYECVGNNAHPGNVSGHTGPNGLIDNATNFASCTLYDLP